MGERCGFLQARSGQDEILTLKNKNETRLLLQPAAGDPTAPGSSHLSVAPKQDRYLRPPETGHVETGEERALRGRRDPEDHPQRGGLELGRVEGSRECRLAATGPDKARGKRGNCFFLEYSSKKENTLPRSPPANCLSQLMLNLASVPFLQSIRKMGLPLLVYMA